MSNPGRLVRHAARCCKDTVAGANNSDDNPAAYHTASINYCYNNINDDDNNKNNCKADDDNPDNRDINHHRHLA